VFHAHTRGEIFPLNGEMMPMREYYVKKGYGWVILIFLIFGIEI